MKAIWTAGTRLSPIPSPMGQGQPEGGRRRYGASRESRRRSTLAAHEEAPMEDEVRVAATTTGVAQVFDLHALKAFAPDKRVRKMLFKTDQLWSEIACYEAGQSTVMHTHPREEEAIFVLEGTANMSIAGEEVVVPAGAIVKFPSNVPHDVRNLQNTRCVIMFIKANPKLLKGLSDG